MAGLLGRQVVLERGITEKDELGDSATGCAERMAPSDSTIMNCGSVDFVANDDEHGGYYIKGNSIGLAIDFLEDAKDDDK